MVLNVEAVATFNEATAMTEGEGGRTTVRVYILVKDLGSIPNVPVCLQTF